MSAAEELRHDTKDTNATVAGRRAERGRSGRRGSRDHDPIRIGVDYPTIPPGPIILLAAAAVVAFGRWRWSPAVGLIAALFLSIGGAIATIAGNGFSETLGDPGEAGGFAGAVVQIVGLAIALPTGIVAAKRSSVELASPAGRVKRNEPSACG